MATILGAFVLTAYIAYLLLWPQTVMWQEEPIKVSPKIVKAGDFVTLSFNYCKYKEAVGDVSIYLVDNQIFSLRTVQSALPIGCRSDLKYPIQIPPTVSPGVYHIRETLDFHLNPLREVHYSYDSEDFEVVK
jgi:hypothetical protein